MSMLRIIPRLLRGMRMLLGSRTVSWAACHVFQMTSLLTKTVLGDKKNIHEIAEALKAAYGFEPILQREGSIDELFAQICRLSTCGLLCQFVPLVSTKLW